MRVQLRVIKQHAKYPVFGVAIPKEVAIFFQNVEFNVDVDMRKKVITLTSGASQVMNKEQLKNYNYEDARI